MSDRLQPRRGIRLVGGADSWRRPLGATLSPVRRRLRGALLALFGFLLGCVLFDRVIMPRVVRLGDEIDVPEVVGLSLEDAKKKLGDTDLKATTAPGRFSNEIPRGQVLLSLPQSGSRVKRNRQVELTLSLGAEDRRIPQLLGQSIRMARIELQERGLRSGAIVYAANEEMSPDQVMAMSPAGGAAMVVSQTTVYSAGVRSRSCSINPKMNGNTKMREVFKVPFRSKSSSTSSLFSFLSRRSLLRMTV